MPDSKVLYVLWTNDNLRTSQFMVMKYATKSMVNRWWDKVIVVLWGPTVKLAAENAEIQEMLLLAQNTGVEFSACIDCSIEFGVVDKLKSLGVNSIAWGERLSEIIQSGEKLISI